MYTSCRFISRCSQYVSIAEYSEIFLTKSEFLTSFIISSASRPSWLILSM